MDVADGNVDELLEAEYDVDAVEAHHHPGERLGFGLTRVLNGRDDRVVAHDAALREVDVVFLGELHRVDRAVAATARVEASADRALLSEEALLDSGRVRRVRRSPRPGSGT